MSDNKIPDNKIILDKDGLPRARSVHEFNMMSDSEKAAILAAWTKTWSMGGSAASTASPRRPDPIPELPKVFDSDDRTIRDHWRPSLPEREDIDDQSWK